MRGLLSLRAAAFLVLPACLSLTHCGLDTSGALDADLYPEDQGGSAGAPIAGTSGSSGQAGAGAAAGSSEGPGGGPGGGQGGQGGKNQGGKSQGGAGQPGGGKAGTGAVSGQGQGGEETAGQGGDSQGGQGGDTGQGGAGAGDAGQGGDSQGGAGPAGAGGGGQGGAGTGGAGMAGAGLAGAGTSGEGGGAGAGMGGAGMSGAGQGGDLQGGAGQSQGGAGNGQGGAGAGGAGGDLQGGAGQGGDAQGGAGQGGAGQGGDAQGGAGGQAAGQGGAGMGGAGLGGAGAGGAGMGGGGMGGVTCNNDGFLDPGEECDAGMVSSPYCAACVITCGPHGIKDPVTRHCYEFFPDGGDKKKWKDARNACGSLNGAHCYLAVPSSDEEIALLQAATGPSGAYQESFWIGATRSSSALALESAFDWVTLDPWRFGPTADWTQNKNGGGGPKSPPWGPTQPDDSGGTEDCVEYGPAYGPGLNDNTCDVMLNYVCECETPGAVCNHDGFLDEHEECDDGNANDGDGCDHLCQMECLKPGGASAVAKNPANQHCYSLFTGKKNWADAGSACLSLGPTYHAVRIRSVEDYDFVVHAFSLPDATWVDGSDQATEGTFVFSDATSSLVPFGKSEFPFHPGEPNNSNGNEDCLTILKFGLTSPPQGLYLNDTGCGDSAAYLCEQDPIKQK